MLPHLTLSHRHNCDIAASILRDFDSALLFKTICERFLVLEQIADLLVDLCCPLPTVSS